MSGTSDVDGLALVTELARRSAVCWISYGEPVRHHTVWHVWHEDAIGLVVGGAEQQLPGVQQCSSVLVTLRSKTTGQRLATCRARVQILQPGTERWTSLAPALVSGRLNLIDPAGAPARWANDSTLVRLEPEAVVAQPGTLPDDSGAAVPVPSAATTTGRLPWVLHRRQTQRRRLS